VLVLAGFRGSLEDLLAGHAVPQDLAGRCRVAGDVDIATPDVQRADVERLRDPVEVRLGGELHLRRAEPAERAVRWRVRARGPSADPDVRAAVRTAGMDRAAREHDRRQRGVGAAVHDDLDVLGEQPAVAGHAGPVPDDRRVSLGRGGDVLVPVIDHPNGSAGLDREQGRMEPDHRRVLLLTAEPTAGLSLDDARLAVVDREPDLQRGMDVVRALQRAVDRHPAILPRHGDHRVVLDVELFLVADAVFALEDQVGRPEGRVRITGRQLVLGEQVIRDQRVEGRGEPLGHDAGGVACGSQRGPIRRSDQDQRLGMMLDLATDRDEDRLVGMDGADDVLARDVGGRDDHDLRPVERRVDLEGHERGVGIGRSDRRAMPGAGEDEIVGILRGTRELRRTFAPERRNAAGAPGTHRSRLDDDGVSRLGPRRRIGGGTSLHAEGLYHRRCALRTWPDEAERWTRSGSSGSPHSNRPDPGEPHRPLSGSTGNWSQRVRKPVLSAGVRAYSPATAAVSPKHSSIGTY